MTVEELIANSSKRLCVSPLSLFRAKMPDGKIVVMCVGDFKFNKTFMEKCGGWEVTQEHITQEEIDSLLKQK